MDYFRTNRSGRSQTRGFAMECISCNEAKPPYRVVMDTIEEAILGGYCQSCEEGTFGQTMRRQEWQSTDECLLCDRDGFYALPLLNIEITDESQATDDNLAVSTEPREDAVGLCDHHLNVTIAPEATSPRNTVESTQSRM